MNEEAIQDAYNLFVQTGYNKDINAFKQLIGSNPEALQDAYNLFVQTGYNQNIDSFKGLMGVGTAPMAAPVPAPQPEEVKKKEESGTMGLPVAGSLSGLPSQQEPKPAPTQAGMPQFFQSSLDIITPQLIDNTEEFVVPKMNYQFGPMGFKFEESGATGDWMVATAPNGKTMEFSLDPAFGMGADKEANKLKSFISENTTTEALKSIENQYTAENKKFNSQKQIDEELASINQTAESFKNETNAFLAEKTFLDEEKKYFESIPISQAKDQVYFDRYSNYVARSNELTKKQQDLVKKQSDLQLRSQQLNSAVGKYVEMESKQGDYMGAGINAFFEGVGAQTAGIINNVIDLTFSKYLLGADEEDIKQSIEGKVATGNAQEDAKDNVAIANALRVNETRKDVNQRMAANARIPMPQAGQSYADWYSSLSDEQRTAIVDKANDDIKKDLKINVLPAAREGARTVLGDDNTTVAYSRLLEEGFWGGALLGTAKSLPALIGGNNAMGWATRTANMYAQNTDAIYKEMEQNPNFKDISEEEKLKIIAPIGITSAALESLGFRNVIANKGLLNRVALAAIGKAGATTTAKTFGDLVKNEAKTMLSKGLLTLTGAGLAEAETGAAQQVSEYAFKELYNAIKGKEMFDTPDFMSAEYVKDIAKAGAQEAIGGFVLGTLPAISAAYSKSGYQAMDDNLFKIFEKGANDENFHKAIVADVKLKVSEGKMTLKEGKEMLNNYRNSIGLFNSLPENLDSNEKKAAMNLLKEKRDLEQQISGKDEALTRRQRNRISEINTELETLSETAATRPRTITLPTGNEIQVEPEKASQVETLMSEYNQLTEEKEKIRQNYASIEANQGRNQEDIDNEVEDYWKSLDRGKRQAEILEQINNLATPIPAPAPAPQQPGILSSPETTTTALEDMSIYMRTNMTFQQEDGTVSPIMGNEKMLAEMYHQAMATPEAERTPAQLDAIDTVQVSLKTQLEREAQRQAQAEQARPARGKNKGEIFRNTMKSLVSILPGIKVSFHKNGAEMKGFADTLGTAVSQQIFGGQGGVIVYDQSGKPTNILINEETSDATTLPHEVWHAIFFKAFGDNPQLFNEFRDRTRQILLDNGYNDIVDLLDEFEQTEEYINSNTQGEEWMVQLGGLLTASDIDTTNLSKRSRSLLEQLKGLLNEFAKRITGQPMFLEDATPEDVLDFMVAISDRMSRGESIADFFRNQEERQGEGGARVKPQIVGEGARLTDEVRADLKVAQQMEDVGKDAETIRLATGWEKGADGKWRYETADNIPFLRDVVRLVMNYMKENKVEDNVYQKAEYFLPPELMSLYPELNDVTIQFDKGDGESLGEYNPLTNRIRVTIDDSPLKSVSIKNTISTLLHEVQHAIQEIEGFAKGGNPEGFEPDDTVKDYKQKVLSAIINNRFTKQKYRDINDARNYLTDLLTLDVNGEGMPIGQFLNGILQDIDKMYDTVLYGGDQSDFNDYLLSDIYDFLNEKKVPENKVDEIVSQFNKFETAVNEIGESVDFQEIQENVFEQIEDRPRNKYDFYKRIAGEVEARNVQTRMNMTPEERRQITLQETEDIERKKQIVKQQAGKTGIEENPVYFDNAKGFASKSSFDNKIQFKKAVQDLLISYIPELKKKYGKAFDPSKNDELTKRYLSDIITSEAVKAIEEHPEAIGWYDEKTRAALDVISAIHPEVATDNEARGSFILPLAVMSNGNLVDFNFDLAEKQYDYFKKNGRFNPVGGFGLQQSGIKKSLLLINSLLDNGLTMSDINTFLTSKYRAGDLKVKVDGKVKNLASGELANEMVYGAVILGPKIGNGFYMNLWGQFDQLTMDRWFMRTWGRLTGTLLKIDKNAIAEGKKRVSNALDAIKSDPKALAILKSVVPKLSGVSPADLAKTIEKASMNTDKRAALASNPKTDELRKAGNSLSKSISGEKEAPANGNERKFIRDVFTDVARRLKEENNIDITMADLQAVLWYPEKILYESFKEGQTFEGASEGYTSESAPDYFNAAKKLATKLGVNETAINQALSRGRERAQRGVGKTDTTVGESVSGTNKEVLERVTETIGKPKQGKPKVKSQIQTEGTSLFRTEEDANIGFQYDTDKVARERFNIYRLNKIGSGSDRVVFDLGDGKVLKVAKTARGLEQNIYEGDGYLTIIPKIFERGLNYVVTEKADRLKAADMVPVYNEDGDQIGEARASEMIKDLQRFTQKDFDNHRGELQEVLMKYGLQDAINYNVLWNDFTAMRNWGYKDGMPLHTDGGTFGGVDMLTARSSKSLTDPEFREIYEKSKKAKKEFGDNDVYVKFQKSGNTGIEQVRKVAQRYNVNNQGFAPRQVNDSAMRKELEPLGYSVRRAKTDEQGRGGGVFIIDGNGRFFNPFRVKSQRISLGAGRLMDDITAIPGYDRMLEEVNAIIERTKRRGASQERIMKGVMDYVMTSAVYERANDTQREQLVRNVQTEFGKRMKSAPSVGRLLGTIKDIKNITLSEKELLKQQIKSLARGARTATAAWRVASRQLADDINELVLSGKVTTKQVSSIIKRFANVNMFNEDSIDKFVDYMTKVFEDANYAEKIDRARRLLPTAKKNIRTKIGISEAAAPLLQQMFAINPNLIPDAVLDKYLSLVEMFGEKAAVLTLADVNTVIATANEILDAVDEEVSLAEELAIRFENYPDKVFDDDGKLDYAATLAQMQEQNVITEADAKLMQKYKKLILPKVERPEMTEAEIEQEKDRLISVIGSLDVNDSALPTRDERDLAKELKSLLKPEILKQLTISQLNNVIKLIDNINNGYLPHYAELTVERLDSFKNSKDLVESVKSAKPLSFTKIYSRFKSIFTRKNATLEMVRRSPLYYIDQVFGDFKSKKIFDAVFKGIAEAQALFDSEMNKINKKLDDAHESVAKSFKYNSNKTLMSSFKMMTYMLQLEYESNPGNKEVHPVSKVLKATIKHIDNGKSKYGDREANMLQEILDNYTNAEGEIDINALYDSFNPAEKKAIKTIQEINESMRDKAVYTAAVIRGDRINPLNNYVHHYVMHEYAPDNNATGTQTADAYNDSMRPSTRAQSLIERTRVVSPMNFDVFASAQRGAKFVLLDYTMTKPIRTARKTMSQALIKLEEQGRIPKEQREAFNAIDGALDEVVRNVLTNNFITDSIVEEAVNFISKTGYRAILASIPRFIAELSSNIGFVVISDPKAFANGMKYKSIVMSPSAVSVLDNVGSKQTTRLFHGDTLSGRLIDRSIISQSSGVKGATAKNDVANVANAIYNMSLKKYKNAVELLADGLISTPDKIVMRPLWFGSFATEFKNQTGQEVDFDKIASNDEAYMNEYKEAIKNAKDKADERTTLAGATDNAFMGMLKGTSKPNQSAFIKAFNNFNNFMTRFAIYEYTTARQGIYAAMGNGTITRRQGAALLAAVATRMTTYTLLSTMLGSGMLSLFADDDEEDEKSFMQKFSQALSSMGVGLILGRDFGNATKSIINYGVEEMNEEFLTALREGDYDPYKDAISYSIVPKERKGHKTNLTDFITQMGGSFGPALKTSDLIARKMFEAPKKEEAAIERGKQETQIRIPLEVLGHLGYVPLYKDIRKIVMDQMYKDLENADKKVKDKKQAEKEMLHGYENKTDMKRYNPELYERVFGEKSPGYDAEQAKKKIEKEKDDLERRRKDEFYNYTPKKTQEKSSGFGSKKFGEGSKQKSGGFGSKKFGE